MGISLSREAFEVLVEDAIRGVPKKFRDQAKGLQVVVQSRPGKEAADLPDASELLGLYITFPELPPRIMIYQANLQGMCDHEDVLKHQIALTIRHELAHHLGFSDEDLEERWPEGA